MVGRRPRDAETEHGSFFVHCCESGVKAFLLVNEQDDIISIIDVRERMLANLDADSTTDVHHLLRDEIHCSAETHPYLGGHEWCGEASC